MLSIEKRIAAFARLGDLLKSDNIDLQKNNTPLSTFARLIEESHLYNPWFTPENVRYAVTSIGNSLEMDNIQKWLQPYDFDKVQESRRVGVVMAGNIPLVGFHDFLSILLSGHRFLGKLSSDDQKLVPAIAEMLIEIEPGFENQIEFTEDKLQSFDAIIATGSNNTARYFEYYFGKYPHIIRKNRNGVAIINGNETKDELVEFGKDLFLYFGLGCRSVSKVFVPEDYMFDILFEAINEYQSVSEHFKYNNNYEYYKSIYLINKDTHYDYGYLLIKQETAYSSPPSVLYFETYEDICALKKRLMNDREQIQCVIGNIDEIEHIIPFGQAQNPALWDYADGVDTMAFLLSL
jgi:hypothetical protein